MLHDDDAKEATPSVALGHNGGPPLDPPLRALSYAAFCWKQAQAEAWRSPPREVVLRRLKRAAELGMSYREYTAVILDRGVWL